MEKTQLQKRVLLIKTDGTIAEISLPTLHESQKLIGGYLALVPKFYINDKKYTIFADEDGMMKNLPVNYTASKLFVHDLMLFGDVLILEGYTDLKS